MYMKTKEKVKKSGSADRRFCGLRLFQAGADGPQTESAASHATPELNERTENVYENKEQVQKVEELRTGSTRAAARVAVRPTGRGAKDRSPRKLRHSREGGNPLNRQWVPAFAGTTAPISIRQGRPKA